MLVSRVPFFRFIYYHPLMCVCMARVMTMAGNELFPDLFPNWANDDYLGAARRAGIPLEWLGECRNCPLLEVCAADDCGRLGFSVSVDDPVKYGFHYRY